MKKPSATDWDKVDALQDDQIDTSEVAVLLESFFAKATWRMPQTLQPNEFSNNGELGSSKNST